METFISILRGINVSGQKKIQMTDLKAVYEKLGFKQVVTYIQSGNVIFRAEKQTDLKLAGIIEEAIFKKYKFDVPVLIRTEEEMQNIVYANPFLKQKGIEKERLYVTFLENTADKANEKSVQALDYSPDKFVVSGKEVYLYCPVGYGKTKLSNNFFEAKLKVKATTRNWNTVNKLLELSTQIKL